VRISVNFVAMDLPDDDDDSGTVDERLRESRAFAEYDEDGQVRRLVLAGDTYDNSCIELLSTIDGLDVIGRSRNANHAAGNPTSQKADAGH
jgi:hypothetical protein